MDEKIQELYDGITLHVINTERFKTDFVAVFMITPLTRNDVTKNALIPSVLTRGTESILTMKEISEYLEENYGSVLDASCNKTGDRQVIQFYVTSINDKYTFNNENLLSQNIDLICDVILKPRLINGTFSEEYVRQEKEALRELIKSKINNKSTYADNRCIEEMCANEPYGLYKYGYEEDLESITSQNLYEQYLTLLSTANIHIYVSGDVEEDKVRDIFKKRFECVTRNYALNSIETQIALDKKELKTDIEKQDVTQGKLVIGLRANGANLIKDMYALMVYNAILGGTASSKLFQNVREKASLAYTTRSSYVKHKGIVLISSGIEIDNYDKALNLIKIQVEDMKAGNFSDEDTADAKVALKNAYNSYLDEQSSCINLYMGQQILENQETIQDIINNIDLVSKDDIMRVANLLNMEMIYFLRN